MFSTLSRKESEKVGKSWMCPLSTLWNRKAGLEVPNQCKYSALGAETIHRHIAQLFSLIPIDKGLRSLGLSILFVSWSFWKHALQGDLASDGAGTHGNDVDGINTLQLTLVRAVGKRPNRRQ